MNVNRIKHSYHNLIMCIFQDKSVGYIIQLLQSRYGFGKLVSVNDIYLFQSQSDLFFNPTQFYSFVPSNSNPKPHAMSHKLHFGFCFQSARHETTRGSIRALFISGRRVGWNIFYFLLRESDFRLLSTNQLSSLLRKDLSII